jgi:hypothetical protein
MLDVREVAAAKVAVLDKKSAVSSAMIQPCDAS